MRKRDDIIGAQRLANIIVVLLLYIVRVEVPFCTVERFAPSYYIIIIIILFFSARNMINKQRGCYTAATVVGNSFRHCNPFFPVADDGMPVYDAHYAAYICIM